MYGCRICFTGDQRGKLIKLWVPEYSIQCKWLGYGLSDRTVWVRIRLGQIFSEDCCLLGWIVQSGKFYPCFERTYCLHRVSTQKVEAIRCSETSVMFIVTAARISILFSSQRPYLLWVLPSLLSNVYRAIFYLEWRCRDVMFAMHPYPPMHLYGVTLNTYSPIIKPTLLTPSLDICLMLFPVSGSQAF